MFIYCTVDNETSIMSIKYSALIIIKNELITKTDSILVLYLVLLWSNVTQKIEGMGDQSTP